MFSFKNLQMYRITVAWPYTIDALNEHLSHAVFTPCAPAAKESIGWIAPAKNTALAHSVGGQILIAMKHEQKLLPASVVKRHAESKAAEIAAREGRKVGRKEMRDLREAAALELLPSSHSLERVTYAWMDPANGWLVVDSSSAPRAEMLLEHLRRSLPDQVGIKMCKLTMSPSAAMNGWIAEGEAPSGFTIDQDLELRSAENGKVRYTKHTLEGDEIRQYIAAGKVATQLALTWNDRLSFRLTDTFAVRKVAFLDIIKESAEQTEVENEEERFDADFALMTGELSGLIADLVAAMGGEVPASQ